MVFLKKIDFLNSLAHVSFESIAERKRKLIDLMGQEFDEVKSKAGAIWVS